MTTARSIFSWSIFPTVLCVSVAVTIWQMDRGVAPSLAFVGPTLVSYLLLMVLERVLPYHTSWNRSRGDVSVDLGHLAVSGALTLELLRPFAMAVAVAAAG